MRTKVLLSVLVLFSLLASCNLPLGPAPATQKPETEPAVNDPVSSDVDTVATFVELTMAAKKTQDAAALPASTVTLTLTPTFTLTPTLTFTSTACVPLVTASVNANVRSGPGTAYDAVAALTVGQSATVVGRNDAYTWWYIDFPGIAGGHGWIAGSVVTSSCIPAVVQVVAAPPLPTFTPTEVVVVGLPDLIVSEFTITPATPTMGQNAHVRIGAYNQGNAVSGHFTVVWYGLSTFANPSCSWNVNKANAHGGRILECDFVFPSWYPVNKTSVAIVDSNNQVAESNEGNNQSTISPFGVAKP